MSAPFQMPRRSFLGSAALGVAAAQLAVALPAFAQSGGSPVQKNAGSAGPLRRLEPLKRIDAGPLNVAYYEAGPANGAPVILLHGWPYDIHMFVDVAPLLAAAGFRVIVPYLRGYGATRFLSADTPRNGQQAAVAADILALMDALKIKTATIAGCDWGARTACIMAALWPERAKALVSVSGYLIGSQEAGKAPLPPAAEAQWWYQYYFATERGRAGYEKNRQYQDLEAQLAKAPVIGVPTITLEGDANGAPHPEPAAYAKKFSGPYEHRTATGGIGHNLPQEAPEVFATAVKDVARR
jgi:pimeloyl-ACP methyl ester carboxylesterase